MAAVVFPEDKDTTYYFVDWAEQGELVLTLAKKILAKEHHTFDRLVALATGGLSMSRALKDYVGIPKLSSVHISFYRGIGETNEMPVITQSIPANISGETVLIFDDKNDSGKTVEIAKEYLKLRGAKSCTVATLWQTPYTKHPSDFFAKETTDWIIFPDEIRETITLLRDKWQKKGVAGKDIDKRLRDIGFQQKQLDLVA